MRKIRGKLVDVVAREMFCAELTILGDRIVEVVRLESCPDVYLLPGFIDSHIHIESSMVVPSEFARLAVKSGTVATVSDPHEIANVLGLEGVEYMLESGSKVPVKFYFGVPSCVPATDFESAGARLDAEDVERMLARDEFLYLSEMMNYPGVVYGDSEVLKKLNAAKRYKKPVDGHAPGVMGDMLKKYAMAGVHTDHECSTVDEALEKINLGMKILIREGSAAKNFDALASLFDTHPESLMLCSDDLHPDNLLKGHVNLLVKRAISMGFDLFDVLRAVSFNPVDFYKLNVGLLQKGDLADFIVVDNLVDFNVLQTVIEGKEVYSDGEVRFDEVVVEKRNKFFANKLVLSDLLVPAQGEKMKLIEMEDGELLTQKGTVKTNIQNGFAVQDVSRDIAKLVVLNRYTKAKPAIAFIKGFQLKCGALASTVAHDSHNIVAVGTNDNDLLRVIELVQQNKGALVAVDGAKELVLPLDVAGIMSSKKAEVVASLYEELNEMAANMGTKLNAPFMSLAFMSLLVIPSLKLGDKGLFDGDKFEFTELFVK